MVYKNFRFKLILRIIYLLISIFLFFYIITTRNFNITPLLIGFIILLQVFSLIHFLESTNRYLTHFLESIRYSDFSRSFQIEGLGKAYDGLKEAFNNVIEDFQQIRAEKEANFHYLQNVIQHVAISLIAFSKNGDVLLINNAAKRLLRINTLKNINSLNRFSEEFVKCILNMKNGEKTLIKVHSEEDLLQLMISAKIFKLYGRNITLVSIQNIQSELETQELEAWQKLIRVLTHEIMNSITPISSLTATVNHILDDIDTTDNIPQEIADETVIDIRNALSTIHKRSTGLIHFVESYRNLTRIPKPDFKIFKVIGLFENIEKLMKETLKSNNIEFICQVEPVTLEITADEQLIEQIIINLLKNSIQALEGQESARIILKAFIGLRSKATVQVIDNGPGILKEVLDMVFIPFFTTKQNGSGIGLSLSKQIMRQHGGTISANSIPHQETVFTLKF
jgi:nitrogen fixation/metabolism regulation signal transduction histidine kinase